MNRNLHSPTKLTEFARDWDDEPETLLSKFVNKITNVYNTSYNTVNIVTPSSGDSKILQIVASDSHTSSQTNANTSSSSSAQTSQTIQKSKTISSTNKDSTSNSSDNISNDSSLFEKQDELPMDPVEMRTPNSILQRISNLVALKNDNLHNYKDTELQRFWMPDSKSKECYECSQKFSTFRRKHHCRLCGQIFCSKCCNQNVPGKIIKCSGNLKVCTYCSKIVLTYLQSPDINFDLKSDLQALQDDLSNKLSVDGIKSDNTEISVSSPLRRKISVGYQEEKLVSYQNTNLTNADRKNILQQSNSLKMLHEEMANALSIQNKGTDLIDFLITNQKSSNKIQATAILNAMIEAGFLMPLLQTTIDGNQVVEFEEDKIYKLMQKDDLMAHSGSFQLDLNIESNSVLLTRPSIGEGGLPEDAMKLSMQEGNDSFKEYDVQNSLIFTAGSKPLLEAFCAHEELLLNQLLRNENLDQEWAKILLPLCAHVANTLRPEQCGTDSMDIRNIVNFKKVPGGKRKESHIIAGIVFSKNVAHKDMITRIEKPKILLLQCAIVYQRVEGKFVSLETLLLQEEEYLRNVTGRIMSLQPNVVLVHKNVAGIAQDMLRDHGITLVLDVKLSVLERLSRCLKCDVVTSIDSNIGRPKLGVCDKFCIRNFTDETGIVKTLMFFETPSSPRGFCILLRGATNSELTRVKRVASFLLYTRYNWRLELAFLMDEFARPPSPKSNIFDSKEQSPCNNPDIDDLDLDIDKYVKENTADVQIVVQKVNKPDLSEETKNKLIKADRKTEDKIIIKENVPDFSDPLRATDLSPSIFEAENSVEFEVQTPYDNKFRTALNSTVLSITPFITFPLPFLETEAGRKCILRTHFPNELYYSKQWSDSIERPLALDVNIVKENNVKSIPIHEFVTHKITASIDNKDLQTLLASFRATGGRLPKTKKMEKMVKKIEPDQNMNIKTIEDWVYKDALAIKNHQRLPVLFCSYYYNPKAPSSFCAQPAFLDMQFYGQNDIMLGLFLERYCFRSSYICPSCNLPMMDHVRRYVHSMGCVQVTINEESKKSDSNAILLKSWCSVCNELTPSVPISNDTWCLSFAKYLELRFHGHAYKRRVVDINDSKDYDSNFLEEHDKTKSKRCCHSVHKDYIHYFSYNGIVASFMYTPIEVWEISLPPLILQLKKSKTVDSFKVLEEIKTFAQKGYEVYAKIYDRLAQLSSDVEVPMLSTLKILVNRDQVIFRSHVENVHTLLTEKILNTHDINDAMLLVRRALAESIEVWGPRLNDAIIQSRSSLVKSEANVSIDSGTICTEDLKPETEESFAELKEKSSNDYLGPEKLQQSSDENPISLITDGTATTKLSKSNEANNKVLEEIQSQKNSKDFFDKKSVRALLSQLLPSMGNVNSLQSPLPSNEHHTLPLGSIPIMIYDQDLSSIIAYSLVSNEYKRALENLSYGYVSDVNISPNVKRKSQDGTIDSDDKDTPPKQEQDKKSKVVSHTELHFQDLTTQFTCKIYFAREFDVMRTNFLKPPKSDKSTPVSSAPNEDIDHKPRDDNQTDIDIRIKSKKESESPFDAKTTINRKSSNSSLTLKTTEKSSESKTKPTAEYLSAETEEIRKTFARSLHRSSKWEAKGGKSGSKFSKTLDDRFIIKEMTKQDVAIFENFAPNYFEYINQCLQNNQPTLLAKILGVFKVIIKKKESDKEKSVLIMENLFYDRAISNKFDLKGSERNRLVDPTNQNGEIVLLDENLIQMSWSKPLYILTHSRTILKEAIHRDASFLEKNDVMDYSLLVGLDSSERLLVLGIIDYIRTFTLDKRLESLVKQSGLLGGQGKLPTVISPKPYKQRFSEAMERYFLAVPDRWEGLSKK